jgi:type II secretory pathway predicted ATPase ExeA
MYESYWKLRERPFENDQNTDYFFGAREYREALVRLIYAVLQQKPCVLLIGEAGCGKSYILQSLANELTAKRAKVGLVRNPSSDPNDLLRQIAGALGVRRPAAAKSELVAAIEQSVAYHRERGSRVVVAIDDADAIENERAYEELRLLLNLEQSGRPILTLVLAGAPRLRAQLQRVPGLLQRVAVSFTVPPMTEEESIGYVAHRLGLADGDRHIFDPRALREIYRSSRGVPRLINHVCDLSLLLGAAEGRRRIDARIVGKAKDEWREVQP